MAISDPFIIENGSAIMIPKNYFKIRYEFTKNGYKIIELGTPYRIIREKLAVVRNQTGVQYCWVWRMTVGRDCKRQRLTSEFGQLAKRGNTANHSKY